MRRFLILCLTLASTAAAETTTIELALDEPYELRWQVIPVPFEAGRQFTVIHSVSIRVIGTVGSHGRWHCMTTAEWQIQLAGGYVAAGFSEGRDFGMLQPSIIPGSDEFGGPLHTNPASEEYDQTFVFDVHPWAGHAWDWSFLEDGRAELLIGPVEPMGSYSPFSAWLDYDPCWDANFALAEYRGTDFGLTRVEVTIESDSAVRGAPGSFGAVKSLFGGGTR